MRFRTKPPSGSQYPTKFNDHKSRESGDINFFKMSRDISKTPDFWSCDYMMEAS